MHFENSHTHSYASADNYNYTARYHAIKRMSRNEKRTLSLYKDRITESNVNNYIERRRRYLLTLYHIMIGYRQPKRRVSKHRISLKYRFNDDPTRAVLTPEVIDKINSYALMPLPNSEWYTIFVNRLNMKYAFM